MAYDDFEDGTIDRWTLNRTAGGAFDANVAANKFGTYGGRMTTDGTKDGQDIHYRNTDFSSAGTFNVYLWIRLSDVNGYAYYTVLNSIPDYIAYFVIGDGIFKYRDSSGYHNFTETPSANAWYRMRMVYDGTLISYYLYDSGNNFLESHLDKTPNAGGNAEHVWIYCTDNPGSAGSYTADWDNVSYTSTTEPEPPVTGQFMVTGKYW